MKAWKEEDDAQRERNQAVKEVYQKELQLWQAEQDARCTEKQRPWWKKPVQGPLERAKPKPKMPKKTTEVEESGLEVNSGEDESGNESSGNGDDV